MPNITIYSSAACGFCVAAKNFLKNKGFDYSEVRVDLDPEQRRLMVERAGRTSVPQIFVGEVHVGGYDDMVAMDRRGELMALLEPQP